MLSFICMEALLIFFPLKKLFKSYVFLLMSWLLIVQVDEEDLSFPQAPAAENVEVQLTVLLVNRFASADCKCI